MTLANGRREAFVVRVLTSGEPRGPVGTGFLVADDRVLTCAHVVNVALGRDPREQWAPGASIQIDFPTLSSSSSAPVRVCRVERWTPPTPEGTGGDIAELVITSEAAPAGARLAALAEGVDLSDLAVTVYGVPVQPTRPDGVWSAATVRGRVGGGMLQIGADPSSEVPIQPGFSGSPLVWIDQDGQHRVVGMLVATGGRDRRRDGQAVTVSRLLDASPGLAAMPPSPYRGLAAFTAGDAARFIGRESDVATLRAMTGRSALTVVIGASGVGKSSLVEAGLAAAVRQRGATAVRIPTIGAESGPERIDGVLGDLAAALHDELGELSIEELRAGAPTVIARRAAARRRQVLVHLDQFEQLLVAVPSDRHDDLVTALLPDPSVAGAETACRVVVSLRADFLAPLLEVPGAGRRLQDRVLTLSPMEPADLVRAITEPAEEQQVTFESGLPEQIAADAGAPAGGLPLMQFCLEKLWAEQRDRTLTFADYRAIGGVAGVVDEHAKACFAHLADAPQSDVKAVLLALVRTRKGADEAIARAVPLARLAHRASVREAVDELSRARLVTVSVERGDAMVTIAHEAIIRSWSWLREAVDADVDFQRWLVATEDRLADDELLPESRLGVAEGYVAERPTAVPPEVADLVRRSRADVESRRRRRRQIEIALAALVVVAIVLVVIVAVSDRRLASSRDSANARTLGQLAQERMASDPGAGTQLALAAMAADPDQIDARNALASAFTTRRSTIVSRALPGDAVPRALVTDPAADVTALATPTGPTMAEGLDGTAPSFRPVSATPGATPLFVGGRGRWVVLAGGTGPLEVWDRTATGAARALPIAGSDTGSVTPDGDRMIAATGGSTGTSVRVVDLSTGAAAPGLTLPEQQVAGVWQTTDPARILVRTSGTQLSVRDGATGALVQVLPPDTRVADNGALTVRCGPLDEGASLFVSDAASGAQRLQVGGGDSDNPCQHNPALTADGRHVAWLAPSAADLPFDLVEIVDLVDGRRTSAWVPTAVGLSPTGPQSTRPPESLQSLFAAQVSPSALGTLSVHGDRAQALDRGRLDALTLSAGPTWRRPGVARTLFPATVADGSVAVLSRTDGSADSVRTSDGLPLSSLAAADIGLRPGEAVSGWVVDARLSRYRVVVTGPLGGRVLDFDVPSLRPVGEMDLAAAGADGFPDADGAIVAAAGDRTALLAGGTLSWWSSADHRLLAPPVSLASDAAAAKTVVDANRSGLAVDDTGATVAVREPGPIRPDGNQGPEAVVLRRIGSGEPLRVTGTLPPGRAVQFAGRRLVTLELPGRLVVHDATTGALEEPSMPVPPSSTILGLDDRGRLVIDEGSPGSTSAVSFWDLDAHRSAGRLVLPYTSPPELVNDRLDIDRFTDFVEVPVDPAAWRAHLCQVQDRPFDDAERAVLPPGTDTDSPCGG